MEATSTLHVDLDAIAHNVEALRRLCDPKVRFCAVLKADGYGLGAHGVASTLARAGSSMFAVFSLEEADDLADQPIPILVLMPTRAERLSVGLIKAAQAKRLHFVIHEAGQLEALDGLGHQLGVRLPVHLKVDTGLHRGGCSARDAIVLIRAIQRAGGLDLVGLMTHFAEAASSEETTAKQMHQLRSIRESIDSELPGHTVVHASGTCGVLRGAEYHADMVRVGLGWCGYLSHAATQLQDRLAEPLQPAVSWQSSLAMIRTIGRGERVGYGGRWVAERPTRPGVIPVGYADGYPGDAGEPLDGGPGLAIGLGLVGEAGPVTVPVVGRVSMDQLTVDLTDAPAGAGVGTPVELISRKPGSPCGLQNLAGRLGLSPHAILVRVHARVPRRHESLRDAALPGDRALESKLISASRAVAG